MAKIQAAIIQIPKPESNRTLKAIEAQKLMKKKKEAEVSDSHLSCVSLHREMPSLQ
jgi:hypothetical protein